MSEPVKPGQRTLARAAATAAERFGDRVALRHREGGEWRERTFAEVGELADELALGLVALGLEPGDRACILANTRPEWTFASLAISRAGGVVVPIYPSDSPEQCEWVAGNSEARMIVCEDASQLDKIAQVRGRLERLEQVIVMDPDGNASATSLEGLRERGRGVADRSELELRCEEVSSDDPYTVIYTSGTTGPPKGVVLTHGNCASVGVIDHEIGFVTEEDVSYLYLPLAHAFALMVQLATFEIGGSIVYFGGDTKRIVAELQETKPTYLPSVPRIFEKIYALATAAAEDEGRLRQAVELGVRVRRMQQRGEEVTDGLRGAFEEADDALYRNVRGLFGGEVKYAVSGAAPIAAEILEFFYACGVPVLEGWGMTETAGVGCVNTLGQLRFGTVGQPLPGVEVKLADDGEVLTTGPNVFREYWRDPEATREAFTADGWLRTGDLGSIDEDGFVSITGRKKDIIITAGGKNLTPANLENDLRQSRWISHAVMYGDRRPYPVALITLDSEEILPWALERGLPDDLPSLIGRGEVRDLIQAELDRANAKYAQVEQIKKFELLDHDFSQESGELTATQKLRRNVVTERYADLLEQMYGDERGRGPDDDRTTASE
ncbi:MAG TPA: long-chain fatty acid--CoA ligase [Acidimicrobiales bacterium]|nr:long-chain fatty acid--CoA ligase [Acidimicrobiales bacterium]